MKKIMPKLILTLLAVFAIQLANAQIDVIDAKAAIKLLKNDQVVMVSARTPSDYAKVHVAGAVNVNHNDLYGKMSMLKSAEEIGKVLGQKGISNSSTILLYDNGSSKYAGRMYWILKYMGASNVKIIDGGMKGWRMARGPVTKNPTKIVAKTFIAKLNPAIYASMADVNKAIGNSGYTIVDSRSAEEFNGVATTSLRIGHIPSAVNLDYKRVLTEKGMVKSIGQLSLLFNEVGISKNKTIILYCESNVRAGILFAVLKGMNYPNVKVYDGAYLQWQSVDSNKVIL